MASSLEESLSAAAGSTLASAVMGRLLVATRVLLLWVHQLVNS